MPQDKNADTLETMSKSDPVKPAPLNPLTESERKSTIQLPVSERPPMLPPNIVQPATPAPAGNTQPAKPAPIQPASSDPAASHAPGDSSSDS